MKTAPDATPEILPNLLGIKALPEMEEAEMSGFLYAYTVLFDELTEKTVFDLAYLQRIHKLALGKVYGFAGKFRTVNISKGGFMFAPALYLEQSMKDFEAQFLLRLPRQYEHQTQLIEKVARVHGELLFIHPFREGNGRTSRLLADLMTVQAGYPLLNWKDFKATQFEAYVQAVQQSARGNYAPMTTLFRSLF